MQPTVLYSPLLPVWLMSLSLSPSLMLVLIQSLSALLPPPTLPLSLLAASVIYAFMRVCMHAQAARASLPVSNAHNYDGWSLHLTLHPW